jgi:hypothetical protein
MSDVNTFIETIGKDVNAAVVPKVGPLAEKLNATLSEFITGLIQDLSQRYRPELTGELHARLVAGAIEVTGQGVKLDVKRRDTGATVSSLDVPVSVRIRVDDLAMKLQTTTLRLNVIK